nr:MAG TPA: hypothetical protein [Caudoviricetes sp.]
MRANKQLPSPLNEVLGRKLAYWLCEIDDKIDRVEDFQEKLLQFPKLLEDSTFFDKEEEAFVKDIFLHVLSLTFIIQKHKEEIWTFCEQYNE